MENNSRNSALVRQRVVSVVLGVIAIVAVVIAVSEHRSSSATPQAITGKFMGFETSGAAPFATTMAFQPTGSANGSSYAWAPDTQWQSANGTWHLTGPVSCLQPSDRGRTTVTIGVVNANPVGTADGADLIVWVKC
jgi:hypothetical protein